MEQQHLLNDPQPSAPPSGYGYGPPPPPVDYRPPQAQGAPPPYQGQPYPAGLPPTQNVALRQNIKFESTPVQLRCPNCQRDVVTNLSYEAGLLTWLVVGIMFLLGFWLCCWIPLFINELKDVIHTCPNCHYACGVHKKLG